MLIAGTTTKAGLRVKTRFDFSLYAPGIIISYEALAAT
jgi:hypothetical protein